MRELAFLHYHDTIERQESFYTHFSAQIGLKALQNEPFKLLMCTLRCTFVYHTSDAIIVIR